MDHLYFVIRITRELIELLNVLTEEFCRSKGVSKDIVVNQLREVIDRLDKLTTTSTRDNRPGNRSGNEWDITKRGKLVLPFGQSSYSRRRVYLTARPDLVRIDRQTRHGPVTSFQLPDTSIRGPLATVHWERGNIRRTTPRVPPLPQSYSSVRRLSELHTDTLCSFGLVRVEPPSYSSLHTVSEENCPELLTDYV